jgi:hypothetical protein
MATKEAICSSNTDPYINQRRHAALRNEDAASDASTSHRFASLVQMFFFSQRRKVAALMPRYPSWRRRKPSAQKHGLFINQRRHAAPRNEDAASDASTSLRFAQHDPSSFFSQRRKDTTFTQRYPSWRQRKPSAQKHSVSFSMTRVVFSRSGAKTQRSQFSRMLAGRQI